jgi:hypothetical protein
MGGNMSIRSLLYAALLLTIITAATAESYVTQIRIDGRNFRINGKLTHQNSLAQGLLMNVRMVNAVFEDALLPDFDPEENTAEFVAMIPAYVALGIRAFTISLQGGNPGYEGAVNSAFKSDGSLKASYMNRVALVIEQADKAGAVILLSLFYQRQDQILSNATAVRAAVVNATKWVKDKGYTNVIIEIANEYPHSGFNHSIIRSKTGMASLIQLARSVAPNLYFSASGNGSGTISSEVAKAADLLLIHFNGTSVSSIPSKIKALQSYGKPIVCNEDNKTGLLAAQAAEASVRNGASYGLMISKENQDFPFEFDGRADDPVAYEKISALSNSRP